MNKTKSDFSVSTIIGARPQFIKAATLSRALRDAGIRESIIHTGQHYDPKMSKVFFDEMEIPTPNHFLGVAGLSHGAMTGEMLKKIEEVFTQERPNVVVVYGDTNSTLAGALAAAKMNIPIAHVEAGLRSFNMKMPEEVNRVLTDRVSSSLFCPTENATLNLANEGFKLPDHNILNVGDVMFDATLFYKDRARWPSNLPLSLKSEDFVLVTIHRQESIDDPNIFRELVEALQKISSTTQIIWPVHPRAKKRLENFKFDSTKIRLVDPVSYFEMLALLESCKLVATDSGGLQNEAYFFGKHCLTLRKETEWVELVDAGVNTLCGHSSAKIVDSFLKVNKKNIGESSQSPAKNLYGDGTAALKIARSIVQMYNF